MKHLILYFSAIVLSAMASYSNKHVSAQTGAVETRGTQFIEDAQQLETMPEPTSFVAYVARRTYGTPENRIYLWVPGIATGGNMGMSPDTLAMNKAKHFIIQRTNSYFTTIKLLQYVVNIPDFYTKIAAAYGLPTGINVKYRLDSVALALSAKASVSSLSTEKTRAITREDSLRNALNVAKATISPNPNSRIIADSIRLVNEINRATTAEATKANLAYANSLSARIVADSLKLIAAKTTYYGTSGVINQPIKKWVGRGIIPTTGNGYSIDISSAGFTTVLSAQVQAYNNSSTITSLPIISGKICTTTTLTVNIVGSSTVPVVLINAVTGLAFLTPLTGVTLDVEVTGY